MCADVEFVFDDCTNRRAHSGENDLLTSSSVISERTPCLFYFRSEDNNKLGAFD